MARRTVVVHSSTYTDGRRGGKGVSDDGHMGWTWHETATVFCQSMDS